MENHHAEQKKLRNFARRQRISSSIIRRMVIVFTILSILIIPSILTIFLAFELGGFERKLPSYYRIVNLVVIYLSIFVIPFVLCLPFVLPLAATNRNVYRIVFFRKFNTKSNKPATKLIRRVIGHYGHVFTLSDSMFKVKWWIRIPVLLGQASFFHFRPRKIRTEKDVARLQKKVGHRGWLNVNWLLSFSKIFAVKTVDDQWKATAGVLLDDADLVLFEITELTEAIEWEINTVLAKGKSRQVVLTAERQFEEVAQEWRRKSEALYEADIPLVIYDHKNPKASYEPLREALEGVLVQRPKVAPINLTKHIATRFVPTIGIVLAMLAVSLVYVSPYVFPMATAMYSPVADYAIKGYIQSRVRDMDDAPTAAMKRIESKWPGRANEVLLAKVWDHQDAECYGIDLALRDFRNPTLFDEYLMMVEEAEPAMAQVGFANLRSQLDANDHSMALRLFENARFDNKQMGLRLLEGQRLGRIETLRILEVVASPTFSYDVMPEQHFNKGRFYHFGQGILARIQERFGKEVDSVLVFNYDLVHLLSSSVEMVSPDLWTRYYEEATNPEVKTMLGYLCMDQGSAIGLTSIMAPEMMDRYFLWEYGIFNQSPYQSLFDSTVNRRRWVDLPSPEALMAAAMRTDTLVELPYTLTRFLLTQYEDLDLAAMGYVYSGDMISMLARLREEGLLGSNRSIRKRVAANVGQIEYGLEAEELGDRIEAALLMAYLGDPRSLEIAKEAQEYSRPTLLFKNIMTYPYLEEGQEIERIYWRNAR